MTYYSLYPYLLMQAQTEGDANLERNWNACYRYFENHVDANVRMSRSSIVRIRAVSEFFLAYPKFLRCNIGIASWTDWYTYVGQLKAHLLRENPVGEDYTTTAFWIEAAVPVPPADLD